MPYDTLLYEQKARIGYVTLNRPRVLNAQSPEMFDELAQVFGEIKHDPEVGVVILTGAGDRAFCAGADINFLKQLAQTTPMAAKTFVEKNRLAFGAIAHLGKPVIAAVNGFALGGGCELAMACHIRLASENARFGQPEINLGLFPGAGGTQRLPRLVGKGIALEMMLTGEAISAQEAHRVGLVNKVVPAAELMATAETAGPADSRESSAGRGGDSGSGTAWYGDDSGRGLAARRKSVWGHLRHRGHAGRDGGIPRQAASQFHGEIAL